MLLALDSELNLRLDQEDSLGVSLDLVIPLLNVTTLNTSLFDLLTITYLPNWPIKESFWPSQWYLFSHHLMGLTGPRVPQSCGFNSVGELIVPGTLLKGLSSMFHATLTPKTLKKVQYVVLQTVASRSHSGPPSCRFYTFFSLKRTFQQLPPFSLEDPIANHGHELHWLLPRAKQTRTAYCTEERHPWILFLLLTFFFVQASDPSGLSSSV